MIRVFPNGQRTRRREIRSLITPETRSRGRFILLLTLSCLLLFFDTHHLFTSPLRRGLNDLVAPIQYISSAPFDFLGRVLISLSAKQSLEAENTKLKVNQLLLQAKLQKLLALEKENNNLRALLSSSSRLTEKLVVAQLLAVDVAPFTQQAIINRGHASGLYLGQPVLDAYGVMGQVIDVGDLQSRIQLISDPRSAVPVVDTRNNVRAILIGTGDAQEMSLIHLPKTSDIQLGDALVTSGLGRRFPKGYPVGKVVRINNQAGERFLKVMVRPQSRLYQSRQVLLVWSEK